MRAGGSGAKLYYTADGKSMGKRELLLILSFAIVGAVVYRLTAPPSASEGGGLPVGRLIDHVKREVAGNQAAAEHTATATHPLPDEVSEVWIRPIRGRMDRIEITGTDRADVETRLHIVSRAYDDAEAKATAEATVLRPEQAGATLAFEVQFPEAGRQHASLTIAVPSRLRIRVDTRASALLVTGVASVEAPNAAGETSVRDVAGRVALTHQNGEVALQNVDSVRFTGRNSRLTLAAVRGDTLVALERGGGLTAARLGGAVEIDARQAEVELRELSQTRGPLRVTANGGSVRLDELRSEAHVDGRNAEIDVRMSGAAPVTIYSQGEDVAVTPPATACSLDIAVVDGRIAPDAAIAALGLQLSGAGGTAERRASGALKGGGPTISIRVGRGDAVLRVPEDGR